MSESGDHLRSATSLNAGMLPDAPVDYVDGTCVALLTAAVRADDLDEAEAVARVYWFDLTRSLRSGVAEALEAVPPAALRSRPLLLMLLGMAYNLVPQRRAKGMRYFLSAVVAVRSGRVRQHPTDHVLLLASESAAFRVIGKRGLAVKPALAALSALERMSEAERADLPALPVLYSHVGTSLYYGGKTDEALACFERGLAESPMSGHSPGFQNVAMLAGIHAFHGDLTESVAYLEIARRDPWTDLQRSWYPGTFYRLGEALVALERFDAEGADAHFAAMVHDRRTIEHWRAIAAAEALSALVAGRPAAGLAALDAFLRLRGEEGRHPAAGASLASVRSLLHLALGGVDAATTAMRRFRGSAAELHVGTARIALARGQYGAALHNARIAADRARTSRSAVDAAVVETACALTIPGSRRRRSAVEHLGEQLRTTALRLPVALLPQADFERVRDALVAQGFGEIARDLPTRSLLTHGQVETLLSDRELAVLSAMRAQTSIAAIAADLNLSANTVKTHRRNIYRKLGVTTRDEAIAVALDRHLLDPIRG